MIEADIIIIVANKEALLKHLRKFKEHSIPKSIYIHFYAYCCSYKQEEKTNQERTKCYNYYYKRCP